MLEIVKKQEENKEGENKKEGEYKKEGENDISNQSHLPSDPSVGKDTVEKNVESLTAVKYDVDPLDR